MKKFLFLLAAAVLVLPIASCDKEEKPGTDTKVVVMEPAATTEVAQIIDFENALGENPIYIKDDKTYEILSLEFTEDSRYILRRRPVIENATGDIDEGSFIPHTKSLTIDEIIIGKFKNVNGKLECQGEFEATIEPKADGATITAKGVKTQNVSAKIKKAGKNSTEGTNASRTWEVQSCMISVSGKGVNVTAGFNTGDFEEIAKLLELKGVSVSPATLAGYKVKEVIFTGGNTMAITFTGADPFCGTYSLKGDNISYTLTSGGNEIIGTNASGTLTFPKNKEAELTLSLSIKGYSGTIAMQMKQAN